MRVELVLHLRSQNNRDITIMRRSLEFHAMPGTVTVAVAGESTTGGSPLNVGTASQNIASSRVAQYWSHGASALWKRYQQDSTVYHYRRRRNDNVLEWNIWRWQAWTPGEALWEYYNESRRERWLAL